MTAPTATQLLNAIERSGLRFATANRWDDPTIAAKGTWAPGYVMLHHTANGGALGNTPSLGYCVRGRYPPVRNCHFLIGRDGLVAIVYAYKCYHAGAGGPGQWGDGPDVPVDEMNGYAYGIEIESQGTSLDASGANGYTPAQIASTATLSAALLDLLGRSTSCAINHETWTPRKPNDTLLADVTWQAFIAPRRASNGEAAMTLTPDDVKAVAHAVWNTTYTDIVAPKDVASCASLLLRARGDANVAATRPIPPSTTASTISLSATDIEAIAVRVADLLAERMRS